MICVKFIDESELHIDNTWHEVNQALYRTNADAKYLIIGQNVVMVNNILWIKEIVK